MVWENRWITVDNIAEALNISHGSAWFSSPRSDRNAVEIFERTSSCCMTTSVNVRPIRWSKQ
jgi:hypothetical protein